MATKTYLSTAAWGAQIGVSRSYARTLAHRLPAEYVQVVGTGNRATIRVRSDAPTPARLPPGRPKRNTQGKEAPHA